MENLILAFYIARIKVKYSFKIITLNILTDRIFPCKIDSGMNSRTEMIEKWNFVEITILADGILTE